MNRFLYILLVFTLWSCNDGVFIERLNVSADYLEVGLDCHSATIAVSGTSWQIYSVTFSDAGGMETAVSDNGVYRINTLFAELEVVQHPKSIDVNLYTYLGSNDAKLFINVTDGYVFKEIVVRVIPTGEYEIFVKSVEYTLDQWNGYPSQDFSAALMHVSYPQGLDAPIELSLPQPEQAPMMYRFYVNPDADTFDRQVIASGIEVPVPTYRPTDAEPWVLQGQRLPLQSNRTQAMTTSLPPMPEPVSLMAGKPLEVWLTADYESLGVYCVIRAVNPTTGDVREVNCEYKVMVPVKFYYVVKEL